VWDSELRQAPHLAVLVFARGLMRHLITRMYFPDEATNASDTLLQMVPAERRHTLIARAAGQNARTFEWNVVLQGPDETVFFAW
jgi:protocatechuate 3,4-dioxygenase alpha subunit